MTPAARVAAAITILDDVLAGRSAEQALSAWARASRFAGSKDRAAVRDLVFDGLRCRASTAEIGGAMTGRGIMLGLSVRQGWDHTAIFSGEGHGPDTLTEPERAHLDGVPALTLADANDIPAWMWPIWSTDLGEAAEAAARTLQQRASLFLRVSRRGTLAEAQDLLARDEVGAEPHPTCATCLVVTENPRRVKASEAYLSGRVEIQDAASQIAVAGLDLSDGARVLDYCAGGGGKALAVADLFNAQVTAHDVSADRMKDIAPRAARAGVNIVVRGPGELGEEDLFDVVLVDAPCSGSGTWRRNPEAKWALTPEKLQDFSALQDQVLDQATRYLAPGGSLFYMTCSVFRCENEERVAALQQRTSLNPISSALRLLPTANHDGFFCQGLKENG